MFFTKIKNIYIIIVIIILFGCKQDNSKSNVSSQGIAVNSMSTIGNIATSLPPVDKLYAGIDESAFDSDVEISTYPINLNESFYEPGYLTKHRINVVCNSGKMVSASDSSYLKPDGSIEIRYSDWDGSDEYWNKKYSDLNVEQITSVKSTLSFATKYMNTINAKYIGNDFQTVFNSLGGGVPTIVSHGYLSPEDADYIDKVELYKIINPKELYGVHFLSMASGVGVFELRGKHINKEDECEYSIVVTGGTIISPLG